MFERSSIYMNPPIHILHTEPSVHTYMHENSKSNICISSQPSAASEGKLPYSIILQKYFLYTLTVELYKYVCVVVTYVPALYSSWAVKERQNHRIRSTRYYVAAETLPLWSQQKITNPQVLPHTFAHQPVIMGAC